jgi:polyvinyl alcohol dehydrogenase (cytochrome)
MKTRNVSLPMTAAISVLLLFSALAAQGQAQWPVSNQNLNGTRNQPAEHTIDTSNVNTLAAKWVFTTANDVPDTPTVYKDVVYFTDYATTQGNDSNLYAVNKVTGKLIWSNTITDYDGAKGATARVSPAVDTVNSQLIIGDNPDAADGGVRFHRANLANPAVHNPSSVLGANVIAVDLSTGVLKWITKVSTHPASEITSPPVISGGVIYVGVSSGEEGLAATQYKTYKCCTFRGSVVALEAKTGKLLWQTYTVPDNGGVPGGYSGAAVWQEPAIDTKRGSLYVGTGDNYTAPADVEACQNQVPDYDCTAPDDYFDSLLALDLKTGAIKWARKGREFDTWTVACLSEKAPNKDCRVPASPDFDFGGSGPNLVGDIVGFGEKAGIYWALNAATGDLVWATQVGPGSALGGVEWGTATDGKQIYVAISDFGQIPYTLPAGNSITWGSWAALDIATGKIVWQTADPTITAYDIGSVSVANGVLYAPSESNEVYALDTATGDILWSFDTKGSPIDGPSIADGALYWGSGYDIGTPNNQVYAFTLGGK